MKSLSIFLLACLLATLHISCSNINLFSLDQDRQLGAQVNQEILSNPKQYPVLPERGNEEVYRYIRGITQKILNSGRVEHKDDFAWEVRIIKDDNTMNAFATPGGYIYVYTGLIKYLDSEDQLAGVMGHEIAHADKRHSTRQMTKLYGIQTLAAIATGGGNAEVLGQVATSLAGLKFSRDMENEADQYSVTYLCPTGYEADGAADFFIKLEQAGSSGRPPQFLSTHPNPGNRVQNIQQLAREQNCRGTQTNQAEYARIKRLL